MSGGRRARARGTLLRRLAAIERRSLLLGWLVAGVGAVIVAFAWVSTNGLPFQGHYPFTVIVPGSTPPLAPGDQVRVAGKIAGSVTAVTPGPNTLRVDAQLLSSFGPLGRGASIHVGVVLGTSLVYLVVRPGSRRHPLPPGTVIGQRDVTLSSSLPEALETFNAATRRALARNLTVTGEGWLGNGELTNQAIGDLPEDYGLGTPLLRAVLTPVRGTLGRVLSGAATVTGALRGARVDDVAALTAAAPAFWSALARHDRIARAVAGFAGTERALLTTLPLADRTLSAADAATRTLTPLARQINLEDPSFEALFASRSALVAAVARFNRYAPAVLSGLIPILDELREPALILPLLIRDGNTLSTGISAYTPELETLARQLALITGYTYDGTRAIRITGTLACVGGRDPYPAPGQAAKDLKAC